MKLYCTQAVLACFAVTTLVAMAMSAEPERPTTAVKPEKSAGGAADSQQTKAPKNGEQPTVPDGWIVIDEHIWVHFIDEPARHMEQARESFLKKETTKAAAEIRKAGAYLRATASHAQDEAKRGLTASADELDRLARDMESGATTSLKDLEQAFARVHHALARHHYFQTYKYWAKKDVENTGHHLKAAALYLEYAANAGGHEVASGTKRVVTDARVIGDKLLGGSGYVVDKVGECIAAVGKEVEKAGKGIESHN